MLCVQQEVVMSSPTRVLSEDQLQCSICLLLFSEPVSTPCGHNFCKACISAYWTTQVRPQCPHCREACRPTEIRVNTAFRDIVELFKSMKTREEEGSVAQPGEVLCDICPGSKLKAVKTCMVCLVSYCHKHLQPHQRVPTLMKHQLAEPLQNLGERMCQKHNKVFELFCRSDQVCICVLCLKEEHMTHKTVSLEEEAEERKICLEKTILQMTQQVEHKAAEIHDTNRAVKEGRRDVEKDIRESEEVLQGLVAFTQAQVVQMVMVMKERQKSEETKATDLFTKLHLELAELHQKSGELGRLSQTKDPLFLLNCSSSWLIPTPPTPGGVSGARVWQQPLCAAEVKAVVERVKDTLTREMQRILGVVDDELKVQQQNWVEVELDADTAHPCLVVSGDKKQVRGGTPVTSDLPSNPKRFDFLHCVLAKKGYSSGRFYYQVEVGGQTEWEVGVVRESKLGVSVDYDKGTISFYNADTRTLIYCFSGCTFNSSLLRRVPYSPRTNIYPFVHPSDNGELTISSVQQEKKGESV
ncbi:unnamed protein product [Merluccius merluccius]